MTRRLTQEEAISKAKEVFGEKFVFGQYIDSRTKWEIYCPKHDHTFYQLPQGVYKGYLGCKECNSENRMIYTQDEFVKKAGEIHEGKGYEYGEYNGTGAKIDIKCPKHSWFKQGASAHIHTGRGCPSCAIEETTRKNREKILAGEWNAGGPPRIPFEEMLVRFHEAHDGRYEYGDDYVNTSTPFTIICRVHGPFKQIPHNHLQGSGCRKCSDIVTSGERKILSILDNYEIDYDYQYKISYDHSRKPGLIDFLCKIEDIYIAIEYDGRQHFEPIEHRGGEKRFEEQQRQDALKNAWCAENNIPLIRVPYTVAHDEIEDFLIEKIKEVL